MTEKKTSIFFSNPLFFPPLPFFHALLHSDLWVILDHLKFSSRTQQTQCKLRTTTGEVHTMAIPISYPVTKPFHQMKINNFLPWKKRLLSCIRNDYVSTEFYDLYIDALRNLVEGPCILLENFNLNVILWIAGRLQINPSYMQTRTLYTRYPKTKTVTHMCNSYNAEPFKSNIRLHINNREKDLSALDFLFRVGAEETRKLIR